MKKIVAVISFSDISNDSRVKRGKYDFEIVDGEKELILDNINLVYGQKKS